MKTLEEKTLSNLEKKPEIKIELNQNQHDFGTRNIVKKLESYMDRVTEHKCDPNTVHAAVACADKIVDIIRLHLDVERLNLKKERLK